MISFRMKFTFTFLPSHNTVFKPTVSDSLFARRILSTLTDPSKCTSVSSHLWLGTRVAPSFDKFLPKCPHLFFFLPFMLHVLFHYNFLYLTSLVEFSAFSIVQCRSCFVFLLVVEWVYSSERTANTQALFRHCTMLSALIVFEYHDNGISSHLSIFLMLMSFVRTWIKFGV
jgi:hypothetical protein